jgi:hypothetical protein
VRIACAVQHAAHRAGQWASLPCISAGVGGVSVVEGAVHDGCIKATPKWMMWMTQTFPDRCCMLERLFMRHARPPSMPPRHV